MGEATLEEMGARQSGPGRGEVLGKAMAQLLVLGEVIWTWESEVLGKAIEI